MSVPKRYRATTPEELAVADKNGHKPIKRNVTLREIREVWLYGIDGALPLNEQHLQEMTGATTAQIHRNFPELKVAREELYRQILVSNKRDVSAIMVNETHMSEHKRMVDTLKDQLDEVELELSISEVGTKHHKAMLSLWLTLKDKWEKDTGVEAVKNAMAQMVKENKLKEFDPHTSDDSMTPRGGIAKKDGAKKLRNSSAFDV